MRWPRRPRPRISDEHASASDKAAGDARERMVAEQLRSRGITDSEVLRALGTVERHRFVDGDEPYGDHALPLTSGQTISQPYVVALMTAAARPPIGWRGADVLEIGTGSGYQAAILAELGARVVSIERHESLAASARQRLEDTGYADRVTIHAADGTRGWPGDAPYRAILVTAAGPTIPEPLLEQLDPDEGRLVMPVGGLASQHLALVERHGHDYEQSDLGAVVFVPLIGEHGHSAT